MKKNTMMRLASFLLVAVLMSSSVISGTFAKYVTAGSAKDSARVAAFGVVINTVSESDFAKSYAKHDSTYNISEITVNANDKVVAPGTSSADVNGDVTFSITGTPEVAVELKFEVVATSEVKLDKEKAYNDYTTADDDSDTFTLTEEYYPVKFTLKKSGEDTPLVANGTLAEVAAALNGQNRKYAPNTTLDRTYTLTWAWAFNGNDQADTYLGMNPQTLGYTLNVSVTQVD